MENNTLELVVKETGLEQTKSQYLLDQFSDFFKQASEWESKSRGIVVTDVSQVAEMEQAREARLALKSIRVSAEKTRKLLKENSIREGKAIDGIANVIKALVEPIEDYLENQEKFAENKEAQRLADMAQERATQLAPYVLDLSAYDLKSMSQEGFDGLLKASKAMFEAEQEAIRKAEAEELAKKEAERVENERIRLENEKLKAEAEAREKEKAKQDEESKAILEAHEKVLREEREAREKAEAELKAKEEADHKEKARLEKEAKDKAEAEEKAEQERKIKELEEEKARLLAPDKEKLQLFADDLDVFVLNKMPTVNTDEAKAKLSQALELIAQAKLVLTN